MRLTVLLFARAREAAGATQVELELGEAARVAELRERLCAEYPGLAGLRRFLSVAVNREYAADDALLRAGDEVAVLPPVSGGASSSSGSARHRQAGA